MRQPQRRRRAALQLNRMPWTLLSDGREPSSIAAYRLPPITSQAHKASYRYLRLVIFLIPVLQGLAWPNQSVPVALLPCEAGVESLSDVAGAPGSGSRGSSYSNLPEAQLALRCCDNDVTDQ